MVDLQCEPPIMPEIKQFHLERGDFEIRKFGQKMLHRMQAHIRWHLEAHL